MGDPLSITSGIIAIVTATIQTSKALHQTIQSFRTHHSTVVRLTRELSDLTTVLESLSYHVTSNDRPFLPLVFPLNQCRQACDDFKRLIEENSRRSGPNRTSFRDWAKLYYMSGDVDNFTDMLAGYKATINIALADANLRSTKVTLDTLNDYKDMIRDTKQDLERHLLQINAKLESITSQQQQAPSISTGEHIQRISNDKDRTEKCIEYLKQLLAQINTTQFQVVQVEPSQERGASTAGISPQSLTYADALALSTFKDCGNKLTETLQTLEAYKLATNSKSDSTIQLDPTVNRERLVGEASSLQKRLDFCEGASQRADQAKVHVLEDIKVGDASSQLCVSSLGDLFAVKGATAGNGSIQVFGSMSESGLGDILRALSQGPKVENRASTEELVYASTSKSYKT